MKKVLLSMLLAFMGVTGAFAQFEAGKMYLGADLQGIGLSYSEYNKFHIGVDGHAGYMVEDNWMLLADVGFNYEKSDAQQVTLGGAGRFYFQQNGIFLQLGAHYLHEAKSFNDFIITPEIGYCFFLNGHIAIEPSVYWDMSITNFSRKSKFGLKVGLGWYF